MGVEIARAALAAGAPCMISDHIRTALDPSQSLSTCFERQMNVVDWIGLVEYTEEVAGSKN